MLEVWKDIERYEGLYQVSNKGRVKSLRRKHTIIMKPSKDKDGYLQLILTKENTRKRFYIHRLVYSHFIGEIPEGMQVNHIDEDKLNNNFENLNLMTPKENVNWGTGILRRAKTRGYIVYQIDKETDEIINEFYSTNDAARQTGAIQTSICDCCNGKLKSTGGYKWKYKFN